jgi:hypothetical protein
MSNILLSWMNDELQLSEHVLSFTNTFKDGYLIGEILYRYNQLFTFDRFVANGTPQNILDNFSLIQPVMKKIGVKFNSKIAAEIMNGNETITKSTLYEIKICLESISRNCSQTINQILRGTKHDRVLSVIPNSRPAFDQITAKTFQSSVRGALESTNTALMSRVMKKYEDRTENYFRTISMGESLDQDTIQLHRQRAKEIYKSRKQHEGEFDEAWEDLNMEQWKRNQQIAHERKALKLRVIAKLQMNKTKKQMQVKNHDREYTYHSMQQFDDKLETLIIPVDNNNNHNNHNNNQEIKFVKTFEVGKFDHINR